MKVGLFLLALVLTGCACHQPKPVEPDPPVRVKVARCHPIVEGVSCTDTAYRYTTFCACVGDA